MSLSLLPANLGLPCCIFAKHCLDSHIAVPLYCLIKRELPCLETCVLLQDGPADPKHGQDFMAKRVPATPAGPVSAGQTNVAPTGQAGVGAAGGQAGPSATAAHEEKAERAEGDSHTGKSGGGGAAAAEAGKGKAEKSKSHRAAKAQLVNFILPAALFDRQNHVSHYMCLLVCMYRCTCFVKFFGQSSSMCTHTHLKPGLKITERANQGNSTSSCNQQHSRPNPVTFVS